MKKIVFYGGGNIAQANIKGLISSGIKKQDILYIDRNIRNTKQDWYQGIFFREKI